MNKCPSAVFVALISAVGVLCPGVETAVAHRVNVFAWVEGDTVFVEGKFSGGKRVKAGRVVVTNPEGIELLTGETDDRGAFSFKIPARTDLTIRLIAGQGHQADWTVRAADMTALPPEGNGSRSGESGHTVDDALQTPGGAVETGTAGTGTVGRSGDLEAVVEKVLDRKLTPITRMLADLRQDSERAGVREVFAGIGYILGLVGIAAYVHSRKKKD
jgi:nickel transport protein